jgi:TM2 domain-containing membrane protein YozV
MAAVNHGQVADWKAMGGDKKILAGILGIVLGGLGIHKFVLGYTTEGVIMLLVSLVGGFFTCGISSMVIAVIGIVEGIMYLTKSDEEFVRTYLQNKKGWF